MDRTRAVEAGLPDVLPLGRLRLDRQRGELLLPDGRLAPLRRQSMLVLLALAERIGHVVGKDELIARVWPGRVVTDDSLVQAIADVRRLLGAEAASLLRTVARRGYVLQAASRSVPAATDLIGRDEELVALHALQEHRLVTALPSHPGDGIARKSNLAERLPVLFGRDEDVATLKPLVAAHPVVTVAGPGGIGKTRVGQAVANATLAAFPDGAWWVQLATLSDGALVPAAVARALGIQLATERDPTQAVVSVIRSQRLLLVLDNCEHLIDAVAAFAAAVGEGAPEVHLLVTSQEVLKTAQECVYRLGSLALPAEAGLGAVSASGAGALFVARAQAADRHFELSTANVVAVSEICRHLDGVPLAIELAAARLPLLGVEGLRARLDERFNVLTCGTRVVLRRHQTLRAALEWSHGLLLAAEQAVFRRLGVFAGSFTLESAQRVADDADIDAWEVLEHLGALVDKSLVLAEGEPLPRYRLLETTRLFALERLAEAGETENALCRHAQAMVALLSVYDAPGKRYRSTPAEWRHQSAEVDNVRAALNWAGERADHDRLAIELAALSIYSFWAAGLLGEAFSRLLVLRSRVTLRVRPEVAALFWQSLARCGMVAGRLESHDAAVRAALLYAQLGDDERRYEALISRIAIAARRGRGSELSAQVAEAERLEQLAWPTNLRSNFQFARYCWMQMQGRFEEALTCAQRQAELMSEGRSAECIAGYIADCENALGRPRDAEARARAALEVLDRSPLTRFSSGPVLAALVTALTLQDRHDEALQVARRAVQVLEPQGEEFSLLETLALNAARRGRLADAAQVAGHVDAAYAKTAEARWPAIAERRAQLDVLLAAGLDRTRLDQLLAAGAAMTADRAFEYAFGDATP